MGDKKIVVVQLSGGNDYLNCVVPYNDPDYVDNRPNVRLSLIHISEPTRRYAISYAGVCL